MQIVTITGEKIAAAEQLCQEIKAQLKLPEAWKADQVYGYLAGVNEPTTVVVTDAEAMKSRLGAPARQFADALAFAEEQNSRYLSVLLVE